MKQIDLTSIESSTALIISVLACIIYATGEHTYRKIRAYYKARKRLHAD